MASETLPVGGSRLIDSLQSPSGVTTVVLIPGTEDTFFDTAPCISTQPTSSGRAALVWSHWDGNDYEIAFALFDGSRWGRFKALTSNPLNELEAKVIWGRSGTIHIMWQAELSFGVLTYHAQMDGTGKLIRGPDVVSIAPFETIGPAGGGNPNQPPASDSDVFFAFTRRTGGGLGTSLYGGRDEPMPLGYRIDFLAPNGVSGSVEDVEGTMAGGRLLFLFRQAGKLFYTARETGGWTPYKALSLSPELTESDGRYLIEEMLERTALP